jgi:isopentenyl-diphosphate Delta-isomerase
MGANCSMVGRRGRSAMDDDIRKRKDDHLAICLRDEARAPFGHSLDRILLEYDAVPEVDLPAIDCSTVVLGRRLAAPVLMGAMTGGSEAGAEINRCLAAVAERLGLGLCLGSQRAMLERSELDRTYDVRSEHPGVPLLVGNLGAVQLVKGVGTREVATLFSRARLDALAFHLNPLQEAIQPGGDTTFRGVLERLSQVIPELPGPCLVKEVGAGISHRTAGKLASLPVAGIEASGVGGTSWAMVEALRATDPVRAGAGRTIAFFGVDTASSIRYCREWFPDRLVIGSGGITTGYQAAVALALGADAVAVTGPALRAAREGEAAVTRFFEQLIFELKVVMFGTGARCPSDLRTVHWEAR